MMSSSGYGSGFPKSALLQLQLPSSSSSSSWQIPATSGSQSSHPTSALTSASALPTPAAVGSRSNEDVQVDMTCSPCNSSGLLPQKELCRGGCGFDPLYENLLVDPDTVRGLAARGMRIDQWCCGACALSWLVSIDAIEVRHKLKKPEYPHGPRCTSLRSNWHIVEDKNLNLFSDDPDDDVDASVVPVAAPDQLPDE